MALDHSIIITGSDGKPRLGVGALPLSAREIDRAGYRAFVSCVQPPDSLIRDWLAMGHALVISPFADNPRAFHSAERQNAEAAVDDVCAFLKQKLPVLVFCQAGWNRSALVVARVLVERGMPARQALGYVRQIRGQTLGTPVPVLSNPLFVRHLLSR